MDNFKVVSDKLIEIQERLLSKKVSFASYRKPGRNMVKTIVDFSAGATDISRGQEIHYLKGFVFAPFDVNGAHKIKLIRPDYIFYNDNLEENIESQLHKLPENHFFEDDIRKEDFSQFENQIKSIHKYIEDREIEKLVLSRIIDNSEFNVQQASYLFNRLTTIYPDAFVFLISIPEIGVWVGASPESLLKLREDEIYTYALAGTKAVNGSPSYEAWTEKNRNEQDIVRKFIENLIISYNIQDYNRGKTQTVKAGNVFHLKTSFSFPLKNLNGSLSRFLNDLHPTPAVLGYPKKKAFDLIKKVERHDREYYSGYLGPVNIPDHSIDLYVNLRSVKLLANKASVFVGGGIVRGSEVEKEWKETVVKSQTILNALQTR